ncbi:MAG: hypothetical protein P3T54_01270 [Dehalogenimonas sp.]|uniref:Uncharacterized protein n=2 Tax=Dehalogenimonas TaxID=670486 RepID=A0ABZ2J9D2_9CHLR|nr:hypothetical protein [Dehalogenimonas sp.]
MDNVKPIRRLATIEKAPGGVFAHTPPDVLAKVGTVEFINGFNDTFKKPTGRAVIHRLINRNDINAFITKQGLVCNRVGTAPGKAV